MKAFLVETRIPNKKEMIDYLLTFYSKEFGQLLIMGHVCSCKLGRPGFATPAKSCLISLRTFTFYHTWYQTHNNTSATHK